MKQAENLLGRVKLDRCHTSRIKPEREGKRGSQKNGNLTLNMSDRAGILME
jgi:hypothetical protein